MCEYVLRFEEKLAGSRFSPVLILPGISCALDLPSPIVRYLAGLCIHISWDSAPRWQLTQSRCKAFRSSWTSGIDSHNRAENVTKRFASHIKNGPHLSHPKLEATARVQQRKTRKESFFSPFSGKPIHSHILATHLKRYVVNVAFSFFAFSPLRVIIAEQIKRRPGVLVGGPSFGKPATPAQVDLVADKVSAMASHGSSTMIPCIRHPVTPVTN